MCKGTGETLTLSELLSDPLIRMAMRVDGVSEKDFSELLRRVKDTLHGRQSQATISMTGLAHIAGLVVHSPEPGFDAAAAPVFAPGHA